MQTLGPQNLEQIKAELAKLDEADAEMRRAKLAGIDVSAQEQQSREVRAQLNKLRSAYFPGQ